MKQQNTIQKIFDSIASDYDFMNNVISLFNHKRWRKKANLQIRDTQKDKKILDLATGTADWAISLSEQANNIIGLDYSQKMLDIADKKIAEVHLQKKVSLIKGDATKLPFNKNQFDLITIGFGLRNFPDRIQALNEIHRVLKRNGQLLILETSPVENKFIKPFWHVYMQLVIPLFGRIFSRNYKAYQYLHRSTEKFLTKEQLKTLLEQVGFKEVSYLALQFGAAAIHSGFKK